MAVALLILPFLLCLHLPTRQETLQVPPCDSALHSDGSSVIRRLIKRYTTKGLRRAVRTVGEELHVWRLHRSGIKLAQRSGSTTDLKLHIGCGSNIKPGWLNIDLFSRLADLHLDVREGLPFVNGSVSVVYSEHFFEHLDYPDDALLFLGECLRVLKCGGLFSVGVPDTEWPLKSYANDTQEYFQFVRGERRHPKWCDTRLHNINYHFRQGTQHKYAYDFETLEQALSRAGFVQITRRAFNPQLDSEFRKVGTLYVDARKPD